MTTPTRVPSFRGIPQTEHVKVGAATRAADWLELAKLAQWVRARGRVLVPLGRCKVALGTSPTSRIFRYRTKPSGRAIARVWVLHVRSTTPSNGFATFTLQAGTGPTSGGFLVNTRSFDATPIHYVEPCAKTTSTTDLAMTVARLDGSLEVLSVGCWELPRAALTKDATDLAIDLDTFWARRPIYEGDYVNTRAIAASLGDTDGRRIGHFGQAFEMARTTSAAYVDVFVKAPRIVPRQDRRGTTSQVLAWDVYAWVSAGGTTGQFRVNSTAGSSSVLSVSSTTPAWLGPQATAAISNEDLTEPNGHRGGSPDTVQLQVRRTAGAGEIRFESFCVWEDT